MQILTRPAFDVCVIGSGPAGGFAAKELTEAGATVVMLEAGDEVPPHQFAGHRWPYEFPRRGSFQERQLPFYPDDIGRHIAFEGADRVGVDRIRVLGGRSTHWNAVTLRFSEDDFREGRHGLEPDWPLSYQDLAPFYSYVEQTIGVCGTREGLPQIPDGEFYGPPPNMRCAERLAQRAARPLGIPVIPVRKAMLVGQSRAGRMPCHYCGHCMQGCEVGAIFTSTNTLIPAALTTGRLTLRSGALAREIEVDRQGRASAVHFIDRHTARADAVRASVVVLACGAIESPRLLLNSTSSRHPGGLANGNDLVGRYLHGHMIQTMHGYVRPLIGRASVNDDGATDHATVARFNHLRGKRDYVGGFMAQLQYADPIYPHHASRIAGFGGAFKQRVRDLQPALMQLGGFGKVVARPENRVTVDPARVDRHGIPIPVVHFSYSDNDRALWRDMSAELEGIYRNAETELFFKDQQMNGFASHEVGTCRMGTDAATSVLTPFNQAHDVPNLFVVDGSAFVTFPEKNPTLTIMALSVRAARHIVERKRKGSL